MPESQIVHSTFVLERRLKAAVPRVWASFADPDKLRRWYADFRPQPVEAFGSECHVGGREWLRYQLGDDLPFPGTVIENQGTFLDVVDNERIISSSTMSLGGRTMSASLLTLEFSAAEEGGTDLRLTHQGAFFPISDGPAMREQGWQKLLDRMQSSLED